MVSISDIYKSLPRGKNKNSSIIVRFFIRPLSVVLTPIFLRLNMSADAVSYLALIVSLAGVLILSRSLVTGSLVLLVWLTLDCVDGNIARYKKVTTIYGDFIDSASSMFITIAVVPAITLNVMTNLPESTERTSMLLWSFAASILVSFSRILYQKFRTVSLEGGIDVGITVSKAMMDETVSKKSISYLFNRVEKNLGVSGFLFPILIIGHLFSAELVIARLLICYNTVVSVAAIIYLIIKVETLKRSR